MSCGRSDCLGSQGNIRWIHSLVRNRAPNLCLILRTAGDAVNTGITQPEEELLPNVTKAYYCTLIRYRKTSQDIGSDTSPVNFYSQLSRQNENSTCQ